MMNSTKFCAKCGATLEAGDKFCGKCGQSCGGGGAVVPPPGFNGYASPKQSKVNIKALAGAVLLVLFLGGVIAGVWWFKPQLFKNVPIVGKILPLADKILPHRQNLSDPQTYLPKENIKYTIHEVFPESDEQITVDILTAKINPKVLVTAVEIIPQYEGKEEYISVHYINGKNGVYKVYDEGGQEPLLWLQNNLAKGVRWEYKTEETKIVWVVQDVGVSCDLGFAKLDNCLVIDHDLGWGQHRFLDYYAPGLGVVMIKDFYTDTVLYRLQSYKDIDQQEADSVAKSHSQNIDKLKTVQ